jgi:hypothetical protein
MRALKALAVLVVSLGLVISAYGDTQAKKTKDDKQAQKQVKQDQKELKQQAKKDDKEHKSGIKKVFRNPFKRQPRSQEVDCRKFPNAAGCPDAKQAKQMEKQVSPSEHKVAKQGKPVPKQAFRATQKPAKKNVKKQAKKGHTTAKSKNQTKNHNPQS